MDKKVKEPYCWFGERLVVFIEDHTNHNIPLSQSLVQQVPAAAKLLQSCPTLCNPIDGSSPGYPVPGILQARTLEWVAISFSNAWKWKVKVKSLSRVRPLAIPWTAAYQAPPSMGFSRQEYWSGVPLPSPSAYTNRWYFLNGNRSLRDVLEIHEKKIKGDIRNTNI